MENRKHDYHDSGYKKLFSNPELIRQLMINFTDEEWVNDIDYSSLERIDKSFITDEFISRESDLIYRANFKGRDIYIFLLLEFQSTVDRFMALRIIRYISELYEYLVKNYRFKKLPAVFPVMLYNGKKRWTAPVELNNLIEQTIPVQYIPSFRYCKIAENEFSREFLLKIRNSVSTLFYIENLNDENLKIEIDVIAGLIKAERPEETSLILNWIRKLFTGGDEVVLEIPGEEEVKTMLQDTVKKIKEKAMKEGLQQGLEKGLQKGLKKGLEEGAKGKAFEMAKALLDENFSIEKISALTGLPAAEIKKIK